MKGCKPLSEQEISEATKAFSGPFAARDRALFILGCNIGYRISELLSLTVGDVFKFGKVLDMVTVSKKSIKEKKEGRTMPINAKAKAALLPWLKQLEKVGRLESCTPLFLSKKAGPNGAPKAISRVQAWRVLNITYAACEITGQTGTHVMRKSFADRAYQKFKGDIAKIAKALGHRNVNSTMNYLSFREDDILDFVANL
jgi:integrase